MAPPPFLHVTALLSKFGARNSSACFADVGAWRQGGSIPAAKPRKPFASYAWHFASYEPTEGLLSPPVYFGVLRAIRQCEGERKNSLKVQNALEAVERDTVGIRSRRLKLARDPTRNLFRNSGQYWQALGLLQPRRSGEIELTDLGREVADGLVAVDDFVAATTRNLELPNSRNQDSDEVEVWKSHGIELKPLRLLLEILLGLPTGFGGETFITSTELWRIVIPLAGEMAPTEKYVRAINEYRTGRLSISQWPDCTPKANDERSALEYLLFLARNGLVRLDESGAKAGWRFVLEPAHADLARMILDRPAGDESIASAVNDAAAEQMSVQVARTRRLVEQIHRPGQQKFKRDLIRTYRSGCVVTRETMKAVLIAAHIVPVEYNGTDTSANGLLLRSDIHLLFDAGLLKIHPDGTLELHPSLGLSVTYAALPRSVALPPEVSRENLKWRLRVLHPTAVT